ncbi:hypothetical protein V6N13_115985 [Hibiscus sabdariffa]
MEASRKRAWTLDEPIPKASLSSLQHPIAPASQGILTWIHPHLRLSIWWISSVKCVNAVKSKLQTIDGLKSVEVDLSNQVVRILGSTPVKTMSEAFEQIGRKASLIGQGVPDGAAMFNPLNGGTAKESSLIGRSIAVHEIEDRSDPGTVIAPTAGVGENYKKICACDGTTIWEATDKDFVTSTSKARDATGLSSTKPIHSVVLGGLVDAVVAVECGVTDSQ